MRLLAAVFHRNAETFRKLAKQQEEASKASRALVTKELVCLKLYLAGVQKQ